jgi:hypothetical protein
MGNRELAVGIGLAALVIAIARKAEASPPGDAHLYGQVTDFSTSAPLSGVKVKLAGTEKVTDSSGVYVFADISPGTYNLVFEKAGYETLVL